MPELHKLDAYSNTNLLLRDYAKPEESIVWQDEDGQIYGAVGLRLTMC